MTDRLISLRLLLLRLLPLLFALTMRAQQPVAASAAPHGPFLFSDDSVTVIYGPAYETPFVFKPNSGQPAEIGRTAIEFRHADSWRLGANLADISLRKSNRAEPAAGGGTGALEPYAVLRTSLSWNKLTQSRTLARGVLRDLSLEAGANLESKNSSYSPEERTIYVGPLVALAVPRGYLNLGLHLRKEWNHEAVLGKDESYSPGFNLEPSWGLPMVHKRLAAEWSGFGEVNTPKGKDSFGTSTATEVLVRSQLLVDLGLLLRGRRNGVEFGTGLEYWHNEYGKPSASTPGGEQLTPTFQLVVHLPRGLAQR